jgi:hypothetical protein
MRILVLFSLIFFCFNCSTEPKSSTVEPKEISTLAQWLAIDFKDRPPLEETPFADTPLSKAEANRAECLPYAYDELNSNENAPEDPGIFQKTPVNQ